MKNDEIKDFFKFAILLKNNFVIEQFCSNGVALISTE
jgi:hypothetical protein